MRFSSKRRAVETIEAYNIDELKSAARATQDFRFFRVEEFVKDIDHLKAPHRPGHFAIFYFTNILLLELARIYKPAKTNRVLSIPAAKVREYEHAVNKQNIT